MQKASTRLNALTKVSGYMKADKTRIIKNAFFSSQFDHCLLTWMFHSRESNRE